MNISQNGINLIKGFELLRLEIYDDATGLPLGLMSKPLGNPTVGYGHLCSYMERVLYVKGITEQKADQLLINDLKNTVNTINSLVKVPLTQNQFDSLVSFTFNVGGRNFKSSTLLILLNQSEYTLAANQFTRWIFTTINGKKVLSGALVTRRGKEKFLFNE